LTTALWAAVVLLGTQGALVLTGNLWPGVPVVYVVLSVVAYAMYRHDKVAAGRGDRRIPENRLHLVALVGGWPGAWIAQQHVRHKTRKQPFRTIFWLTVVANIAGLVWLVITGSEPITSKM
jgi:uncharacterized membrane protein YsdA (DUF1294 family)